MRPYLVTLYAVEQLGGPTADLRTAFGGLFKPMSTPGFIVDLGLRGSIGPVGPYGFSGTMGPSGWSIRRLASSPRPPYLVAPWERSGALILVLHEPRSR